MKFNIIFLSLILSSQLLIAQKPAKKDYLVSIKTSKGTMHAILFDDTPKHKANFIKLANSGFYNGTLFHRVINEFMIQGGDPGSKNATPEQMLGGGGDELALIPYEFTSKHVHIRGALAAARTDNPAKSSSGCQFYIVTGKQYPAEKLTDMEKRTKMEYTAEQADLYDELGGTPFLDNNYTVFGQIITGIEAAMEIQKVKTNQADRPLVDEKMEISAKLMKKKKISKVYGYNYQ